MLDNGKMGYIIIQAIRTLKLVQLFQTQQLYEGTASKYLLKVIHMATRLMYAVLSALTLNNKDTWTMKSNMVLIPLLLRTRRLVHF